LYSLSNREVGAHRENAVFALEIRACDTPLAILSVSSDGGPMDVYEEM
jgi:hypothetical protein